MNENVNHALLLLLRQGLAGTEQSVFESVKWDEVMAIASAHGLSAIVFDGLEKILESNPELGNVLPKFMIIKLYALSVNQTAFSQKNWRAACSLSSLLGENGIEAVVLKGRTIAQYYPIPEHRYSCDLDLFIDGNDWKRACELLESKGIRLEYEVYKEVEFSYDGVSVEMHRYITPIRGNKTLSRFERYLRSVLKESPKTYFEETRLLCPSLIFIVMLFIEHALGDLLHGKLTLKHIVDWVVLRKQDVGRNEVESRCKEFGFYKFLLLMDTLADVLEGKVETSSLPSSYREVWDTFFIIPSHYTNRNVSWFARRVSLFFDIIRNRRLYKRFGYCSMESFLLSAVWSHFFNSKVEFNA